MEHRKSVEPALRAYLETASCRRAFVNKHFNNPPTAKGAYGRVNSARYLTNHDEYILIALSVPCCDYCLLRRSQDDETPLTPSESTFLSLFKLVCATAMPPKPPPPPRPPRKEKGQGPRRDQRLKSCRDILTVWRTKCWEEAYSYCIWGPQVLLPPKVLEGLAKRAHIRTVEDIKTEFPDWSFADKHGNDVLNLLRPIDEVFWIQQDIECHDNRTRRRRISEETSIKREETRREDNHQATLRKNASKTSLGLRHIQASVSVSSDVSRSKSVFSCPPSSSGTVLRSSGAPSGSSGPVIVSENSQSRSHGSQNPLRPCNAFPNTSAPLEAMPCSSGRLGSSENSNMPRMGASHPPSGSAAPPVPHMVPVPYQNPQAIIYAPPGPQPPYYPPAPYQTTSHRVPTAYPAPPMYPYAFPPYNYHQYPPPMPSYYYYPPPPR